MGIKQSTSVLVQTKKTVFFAEICCKFLDFSAFCNKNAENDYFDQRLEWAAPKRWSKYTTYGAFINGVTQICVASFKKEP